MLSAVSESAGTYSAVFLKEGTPMPCTPLTGELVPRESWPQITLTVIDSLGEVRGASKL